MKVIRIDGIRGLLSAIFIGCGLFAGFVISPGYLAMHLWNKYLVSGYMFPQLSLFQGVLLWGIVFISYVILTKGGFAISFHNGSSYNDEEMESIIRAAKVNSKLRMMNNIISKADKFESSKERNPFELGTKNSQESYADNDIESDDKISNVK